MGDLNEEGMEEPTTEEIVLGFFNDIEGIWDQITDDDDLTDEQKARLIQLFEDIDGYHDEAVEIFGVSSGTDA